MEHQIGSSIRPRPPRVIEELRHPMAGRRFRAAEITVSGEVIVTPLCPFPAAESPGPGPHSAPFGVLP